MSFEKFDIVIANPPFSLGKSATQLHLQVVQSVLDFCPLSKDAVIVSVQPLNWLLSPTHRFANSGAYRKFSELRERIAAIDVIPRTAADKAFGIVIHAPLGIYTFTTGAAAFDWESFYKAHGRFDEDFYSRVIAPCRSRQHPNLSDVLLPQEQATEYHCVIPAVHGNLGKPYMFDLFSRKKEVVRGRGRGSRCKVVNFATDAEAENFRNSCQTVFYRYIAYCYKTSIWQQIVNYPWLGNAKNPRTKIVGYKGCWEDDDIFDYFGFSQEERDKARKTMETIDYEKL